MPPKRHHYVPKFYLQEFSDPNVPPGQEPFVWVYERASAEPYARSPKKVAVRTQYYSFRDESGTYDTRIEELLSRVESEAAPVLRKLARDVSPAALTDDERGYFAFFVALLSVRVPAFRDNVEDFVARIARDIARLGASKPEHFERTMREASAAQGKEPPADIEAVRQFALSGEYDITVNPAFSLAMLQLSHPIAQCIFGYRWRVLQAPEGTTFVTSDHPLTLVSTIKLPGLFGAAAGWETPWMEAILPLTPGRCLLVSRHHPEGIELLSVRQAEEVNWRTAAYAKDQVYSSSRSDPSALNRPEGWDHWQPVSAELLAPMEASPGEPPRE